MQGNSMGQRRKEACPCHRALDDAPAEDWILGTSPRMTLVVVLP
jgi:hypothetical protein